MILVSELLAKRLICLDAASIAGTIDDIYFDEKLTRGKAVRIFSDEDDQPEVRYAELRFLSSLDGDAAVVRSCDNLLQSYRGHYAPNPINSLVYNQDGVYLGKVRDVRMEGGTVTELVTDQGSYAPALLLRQSDRLLILNDSGAPYKLPRKRAAVPQPGKGARIAVSLHTLPGPTPAPSTAPDPTPAPPPVAVAVAIPEKIPQANTQVSRSPAGSETGYRFLLGKPVHTDIVGRGGRVVIPQGTLVTDEVIRVARDNGKLAQLALRAY